MMTPIAGRFVRIAPADDAHLTLRRGDPERPAARFNRPGQDALYLSPDLESARIAIAGHPDLATTARMVLTIHVAPCRLLDLRHPENADLYHEARQPWRTPLAAGEISRPWPAADRIRAAAQVGLIDPSRQSPGRWHITLFLWNQPGAPTLRQIGPPAPLP